MIIIKEEDIIETKHRSSDIIIRVRNLKNIEEANEEEEKESWRQFIVELLEQDFIGIMNKNEKLALSRYLRQHFKI